MAQKSLNGKRESRLTVAVTRELYEQIHLLASSQGLSVSDFLVRDIQKAVDRNKSVIDEFMKAREKAKENFLDVD